MANVHTADNAFPNDEQTARLAMITAHLDALWPPAWRETGRARQQQYFLVRSHPDPRQRRPNGDPCWLSAWHRLPADLDTLAQRTIEESQRWNEYYSVNAGRADCQPKQGHRLRQTDIVVVPGLLGDWDGGWGEHKGEALHLPETVEELLAFLHGLPTPPSLIIDTGGGVHTYHLFAEPWVLTTPEDRAAFLDLAARFEETVEGWAAERHGWTSTSIFTTDLARVLRLPGTINHKYGTIVTPIETTGPRTTPEALLAWLPPRRRPLRRQTATGATTTGVGTLDIWALAEHYGMTLSQKSDTEWCGSHPVHGSDTGTNVNINPGEQLWHCFRHSSGGDALMFLAMCEGLLDCADAKPEGLRGAAYVQAVELANDHWQAGIVLDQRQARLEAQTAADDALAHDMAVQDARRRQHGTSPGPEPSDPYACPELPAAVAAQAAHAEDASLWLNEYIQFSRKWAPRAYDGFHEACGLFVLATAAAHRIKIDFGPRGMYTSLYLALAARTSVYSKSTSADLGLETLRHAGLEHLLADDDATPQAFLRSLTMHVPTEYADLDAEAQQAEALRLAFAGQKGWFYEEWGQHLQAMMQKDGGMASFRSILRRLDDHKDHYAYGSISRGRDVLTRPYVTLLANVTPADLKPFVRAKSPLWRDGFIARFAFIAPGETPPRDDEFPDTSITYPLALITDVQQWHQRLGIPAIRIEPILASKKKATGRFKAVFVAAHRETTYTLSPDVRRAFYAYDGAMRTLIGEMGHEDLDGSYTRMPIRALRIAALLASLHDASKRHTIWPPQWARGQAIAEQWRADLHKLMRQVDEDDTPTRAGDNEQRVLRVLRASKGAALPVRTIHLKTKMAYGDITLALQALKAGAVVREIVTPRTQKWCYLPHQSEVGS
jgi:hypothetical protein